MYSLQIVESLARCERIRPTFNAYSDRDGHSSVSKVKHSQESNNPTGIQESTWAKQFVDKGGLQHLFDIFMSGILQAQDQGIWSEVHKLLYFLRPKTQSISK